MASVGLARDRLAVEADGAFGAHHAAERAQRGGLARAVGAEQRGDAALLQREADAVQGLRLSVVGLETFDFEQRHRLQAPVPR